MLGSIPSSTVARNRGEHERGILNLGGGGRVVIEVDFKTEVPIVI
jgi:hypothetical protein